MANSADPDQLASDQLLIWIYTVCKGRVYPGSAGLGLIECYIFQIGQLVEDVQRLQASLKKLQETTTVQVGTVNVLKFHTLMY